MKKTIPFSFVIEELTPLDPFVRPLFGAHAIYLGEKIIFILREKDEYTDDNGVWVATEWEHHASLKAEFPSLRSIRMFDCGETVWQNMPVSAPDFEESIFKMCEFVRLRDPRFGRVPKSKKKPAKKKTTKKIPTKKHH